MSSPVLYEVNYVLNVQSQHIAVRFRTTDKDMMDRKYITVFLDYARIHDALRRIQNDDFNAAAATALLKECVFEWHRNKKFFNSITELFDFIESNFGKQFLMTSDTLLSPHRDMVSTNLNYSGKIDDNIRACLLIAKMLLFV